jgi:hypothetical protein
MSKGFFIQQMIKRPGALTRKAKARGMTVAQFIANPPKNIRTRTKQQINAAKVLRKLAKRRKRKKG